MNTKKLKLIAGGLAILLAVLIAAYFFAGRGVADGRTDVPAGGNENIELLPSDPDGADAPVQNDEKSDEEIPDIENVSTDTEDKKSEDISPDAPENTEPVHDGKKITEDGVYTTKEDVALYIRTYGKLPSNFITKKDAEALGWSGGGLEQYAEGKCIGGDRFGNYEGLLPKKSGRKYTACDIDTLGAKSRGAKRIVFSNDGLIFYTDDHYESFVLLYGEE